MFKLNILQNSQQYFTGYLNQSTVVLSRIGRQHNDKKPLKLVIVKRDAEMLEYDFKETISF